MHTILNDLRYALRQLRRSPAFSLTAVLTLALGVGANTAIFSLLDQALLRSLPIYKPQQMVYLQGTGKAWRGHMSSHGGGAESYFSYPMYADLRDKSSAFQALVATSKTEVDLTRNGSSEFAEAEIVSGNYFTAMGVSPLLGRFFTQAEDRQKDAAPVTVLGYDYWQKHMGGDPSIINQNISVNGHPFKVLGVAGPNFHSAVWGETPALFVPMTMLDVVITGQGKRLTDHTDRWLNIVGRLNDGVTPKQAEVMCAPLWHALRADELKALGTASKHFTDEYLTNSRLLMQPAARGFSYNRDDYQLPLLVMMGMAVLVLLIAAVNVASLLLVRSAGRLREFSLRYALGARSGRIMQQLLLEGLLIGIGGGAIGLTLAPTAMRVLTKHFGGGIDGPFGASLDGRLLVFNFAIAIAVSIFFSLAPAMQMLRPDLMKALRSQSSTGTGGMIGFRRAVVGAQICLSLLLLVGAGLFVRTMQALRSRDVGFRTDHLVGFKLDPKLSGYDATRLPAVRLRMLEALRAMPGIESVGSSNSPLLGQSSHSGSVIFAAYKPAPEEDVDITNMNISAGFLETARIPLLAGRGFTENDDTTHPKVAVVNETLAKHYFGSVRNAIGQKLHDGSRERAFDTEIIGVTRDFSQVDLRGDPRPSLYSPLEQMTGSDVNRSLSFYVRTQTPPATVFANIRSVVASVDPMLAIDNLRTMDDQIDNDMENERMIAFLAIAFGLLATLLAGVGLYGVMAYTTEQRTKEIGIRMALGSSRWSISQLVFGDVLKLASAGIVVGVPLAIVLARLLRSQLFGVTPADPYVLSAAVALVAIITVVAALLPARKAASVEPSVVLRAE